MYLAVEARADESRIASNIFNSLETIHFLELSTGKNAVYYLHLSKTY